MTAIQQLDIKPLTKRQQQIFDYIADTLEINNSPPTRAEIAKHFGFKSVNSAEEHLRAIAKKGYIELKAGTSRGIVLLQGNASNDEQTTDNLAPISTEQSTLAVIGDVAAGEPILAQQNIQEYVQVQSQLFSDTADFLLKVKGDSMINAGIFEKDLLAIKNSVTANNNQIVIARIEDDVTVKRYFKQGNHVTLVAENDEYQPIEVDLSTQNFAIEGVVVGLLRQSL